jgi:hypothetical protein
MKRSEDFMVRREIVSTSSSRVGSEVPRRAKALPLLIVYVVNDDVYNTPAANAIDCCLVTILRTRRMDR